MRLTRSALGADADVGVLFVLAGTPVLTGLALTLVDVGFAQAASVAGSAETGEGSQAVLAGPVVAGVRGALVDVHFTVRPSVACAKQTLA